MQYDFNLGANESAVLSVVGKFFKYAAGSGAIRVTATSGGYVDLLPGQGVWSLNFTSLTVQNRSGGNNSGVILAGDYDFHDDRITGDVSIVDLVKNTVKTKTVNASVGDDSGFGIGVILEPSANVAGLMVRSCLNSVKAQAGSGGLMQRVVVAKTAPTSYTDEDVFLLDEIRLQTDGGDPEGVVKRSAQMAVNKSFPAGWGIYVMRQSSAAVIMKFNNACVTYELK